MVKFSQRCQNLKPSLVREILSITNRPGMISFAGGLPAPETLRPVSLSELPANLLQYGPSEGEEELRQRISEDLTENGLSCNRNQILILSGSQQGIDLVAKLFIDPGSLVAVESPTYLAALQVFEFFGADLMSLNACQSGTQYDQLSKPTLVYAIPTFQNPTGHCYSKEERAALADFCNAEQICLFEDDPYRDLVFDECYRRPVCADLSSASWIYQSSFSKTFAPGLRLGYLACSEDLITPLTRLKQAADLHSNRLSQWLVMQHLSGPEHAKQMAELVTTYKSKRDYFAAQLSESFCDLATWQTPKGGLFFWLQLNQALDMNALLAQAIESNVAFMPGDAFFPLSEQRKSASFMRLNFSHATNAQAAKGLSTLAKLIKSHNL